MALDISDINLQAALQARIDALDSNSSMSDILALERAAATFGTTTYYDSAGELPNEPVLEGSIFATKGSNIYQNNALYLRGSSSWKQLQSLNKPKPQYSGETAGFWAGGSSAPSPARTTISKVDFASDTVTGVHGTLPQGTYLAAGTTSATDGYSIGGNFFPDPTAQQKVYKFPFASATPVTANPVTPSVPVNIEAVVGVSDIGGGFGYVLDQNNPTNPLTGTRYRHPFASDTPWALQTGTMGDGRNNTGQGISSETKGYRVGGAPVGGPNPTVNTNNDVWSFAFANDVDAAAIPATFLYRRNTGGSSGTDGNGYILGGVGSTNGQPPSNSQDDVQKFPFANEDISTNIGNLVVNTGDAVAVNSLSSIYYYNGGYFHKFNYGSSVNNLTIADLSGTPAAVRNNRATGHQV